MDHIIDVPESVWDKVMITNVKVAYLLLKEYMSLLRCSKAPSVIFISSIVGYQPMDVSFKYSNCF
jgi:NAD(P)-dependent dehydrogenase (short-subunit alcohol dehydrogenase family)